MIWFRQRCANGLHRLIWLFFSKHQKIWKIKKPKQMEYGMIASNNMDVIALNRIEFQTHLLENKKNDSFEIFPPSGIFFPPKNFFRASGRGGGV
jgi:hypothetical protein